VLTATHHSSGSPRLSDFSGSLQEVRPPTDLHAKWLKRRGFTQGCAFCSKNRYFSCPWSPGPPKRSKFRKCLDFENFRSIWPSTLEVHGENTPYSSLDPNKSDIVNRQGGVRNWNRYLHFTYGYTSRDIAHAQWRFSIVSMSRWSFGQNISETVRDRDLVLKGPPIGNGQCRV